MCEAVYGRTTLKGYRKTKQKKRKKEENNKKTFQGTRMGSSVVFGWQASASRFSSTLDLTQKGSPRRTGFPQFEEEKKVG